MKHTFIAIISIAIFALAGCSEHKAEQERSIFVSIAPLKPIVEGIVGDDFDIEVLVPQGSSPETFEPKPRDLRKLENARLFFSTGLLDFENTLVKRIVKEEKVVNLSQGIHLLAGSCSHHHDHSHRHAEGHAHGIDPHIWCSPKAIGTMADNAYKAIAVAMPDSVKYSDNYNELCIKILELNEEVMEMCRISPNKVFIIYHPALSYLARDYNLQQIAIEHEGKEPSARRLGEIIDLARKNKIRKILYQSEFPASSVEVICQDIEGEAVEINPLAEDIFTNIRTIVSTITKR